MAKNQDKILHCRAGIKLKEVISGPRQAHPLQKHLVMKAEALVPLIGYAEIQRKGKLSVRSGINEKAKTRGKAIPVRRWHVNS